MNLSWRGNGSDAMAAVTSMNASRCAQAHNRLSTGDVPNSHPGLSDTRRFKDRFEEAGLSERNLAVVARSIFGGERKWTARRRGDIGAWGEARDAGLLLPPSAPLSNSSICATDHHHIMCCGRRCGALDGDSFLE